MFKKINIVFVIILSLVIGLMNGCGISSDEKNETAASAEKTMINVVASSFAGYDFVRAIIKDTDNIRLTFLAGPGKDPHSFIPTAKQMIEIQQADVFIYNGGEMEAWAEKVIDSIDTSHTKLLKLMDTVDVHEEKEVNGAEPEEEEEGAALDEHIWTAPANAIKMVDAIADFLGTIDYDNASIYKSNAQDYETEIEVVETEIQSIVDNAKRKTLVFGDKMPFQYFLDEYGLSASAAFTGCSTETEPSSETITNLANIVKDEKIPVVLYIEMGNEKVADAIAEETGAKAEQIQTIHNVTEQDFNNGETYVSLMERNVSVLKDALQ